MGKTKKTLKLGIFIASALILFIVAIYLIGSKQNLFTSTTEVHASFKDIRGLISGNIVRFAGISIGTVNDIRIIADSSVIVSMTIRDTYTDYIYKNSAVQIGQEGLMGGKIVLISTGDPATGKVEEDDYLPVAEGLDIQAMIAQATVMLEEANGVIANLRSVTDKIDNGDGDIARLINDNSLTTNLKDATSRLNASLSDVNQITSKINNGHGDLGKLVNDDSITTQLNTIMANLSSTTKNADSLVNQLHQTSYSINHGEGVLPRLLNDKQMGLSVDTAIANVDQGVIEITKAAETIANSWIFRLFSKNKNKQNEQQKEPLKVNTGDTLIIRPVNRSSPEVLND
ncbi:MAG: MlaD family protein [Proteiniphilum sp.]|jgi:phospholipid/cholesterol/gamma-HCH transport system substrate-binding protein|nr:MlaD family protein [Petrimonas sp.]MDD4416685.1 MlaD family protein [Proteiniphilum sp.]BBD44079.1 Mammalian cell entry related domain protein [Petrimonas sp. IBARAKI]